MTAKARERQCRRPPALGGALLLTAALLAACAGSGGASPSPVASAVATPASPTPLPTAVAAVDEAAYRAALEGAVAELMAAIGNPDTGSPSDASKAFDDALASGDPAVISSTADAVLAHLSEAQTIIAGVAGWQPGAEQSRDWDAMLAGLAEGVITMRDGGTAGDQAAVDAGRTRMGEALQDHFWPAIRGPEGMAQMLQVFLPDGRSASASRGRYPGRVGEAFDGNPDTMWIAGDAPAPQWIELDLGWEATITGVRLLTYQDVSGATDHLVTVRGASGSEEELTRFTGQTRDRQWLEHTATAPVTGVQVVRVTTLATPSMIGWREIEVTVAPGLTPSPCPAGTDEFAAGAEVMGEPSLPGHEPALAVDGDETTGWDPGDTRGPGNVRGWIRVLLAGDILVSEVRVLLGPASAPAGYEITGWTVDGRPVTLGKLESTTGDRQWLSVPGPTPCAALRSVDVAVTSEAPAPEVREIVVQGASAP